jgi:hypothetical protein
LSIWFDLAGEELTKAAALRITDKAVEVSPGSLPEAFLVPLRKALEKIREENAEIATAKSIRFNYREDHAAIIREHF